MSGELSYDHWQELWTHYHAHTCRKDQFLKLPWSLYRLMQECSDSGNPIPQARKIGRKTVTIERPRLFDWLVAYGSIRT